MSVPKVFHKDRPGKQTGNEGGESQSTSIDMKNDEAPFEYPYSYTLVEE